MDDIRDYIKNVLILVLLFFCLSLAFKNKSGTDKKDEYSMELWKDPESGVTMRIFKDGLGDVLYCEPVEVEVNEN